jgi:predicted esterase
MTYDPHANGLLLHAGVSLSSADALVILLHGRGGSAADILSLMHTLDPEIAGLKLAWLAPEAAGRTWYPNSFLAPREANEPYLSSALARVGSLVAQANSEGIPTERIVLGGFSQGACLTSEFVASHPARYAGMIAFTGGLVGPLGSPLAHAGDLAGTPALLLSGDPDPHVPISRVEETAAVLTEMNAKVTLKRYPGRTHRVSQDEAELSRALLQEVFARDAHA